MQLGIFGWQTAAIKYEKDRAANTLLPNYNTYGRYDIPSYYESYWQSPEERYYTGEHLMNTARPGKGRSAALGRAARRCAALDGQAV